MSNNNSTQNLKSATPESLDWAVVQKDMKSKLGNDIYGAGLER